MRTTWRRGGTPLRLSLYENSVARQWVDVGTRLGGNRVVTSPGYISVPVKKGFLSTLTADLKAGHKYELYTSYKKADSRPGDFTQVAWIIEVQHWDPVSRNGCFTIGPLSAKPGHKVVAKSD